MKYYRLKTTDPYLNLATEEYLLENEDDDVFMLWQNEPSVVVGINQNIRAEVDTAALNSRGVHPVRRITGGGAVYHDEGNLNYTFIARSEGGIDFKSFSEPIIKALATLGVTLTLSGRNDLCLPDGRKVSGNAQCKRGGRVLHHGTLLFESDLGALSSLLTPSPEKLATKAIRSTAARVANLRELLPDIGCAAELADAIEAYVLKSFGPTTDEPPTSDEVLRLAERNRSDMWLYPESGISASFSVTKEKRYPFGTVSARLSFLGDTLTELRIEGDFFGEGDVGELEKSLSGKRTDELGVAIRAADISKYIHGMTPEELELLFLSE